MAKVSVSITATTQQNKDKTRTLGYVNPEATNEQLQQMAAAYNALSTKVYQNGEKIVRTDLAEPTDTSKTIPTITLAENFRHDEANDEYYQDILTCDTDATSLTTMIKTQRDPSTGQTYSMPAVTKDSTYGGYGYFRVLNSIATSLGTLQIAQVTITAPETGNYTPLYFFKDYKES